VLRGCRSVDQVEALRWRCRFAREVKTMGKPTVVLVVRLFLVARRCGAQMQLRSEGSPWGVVLVVQYCQTISDCRFRRVKSEMYRGSFAGSRKKKRRGGRVGKKGQPPKRRRQKWCRAPYPTDFPLPGPFSFASEGPSTLPALLSLRSYLPPSSA
jgi:hypothetical protein